MEKLRSKLVATYLSFDSRSLALFRIALGVTLWADLWRRYRVLDAFYTNEGILPNHTLLWSPVQPYTFSLFFSASLHHEALWLMIGCGLVYGALALGYRTKWAQALSLLAVASLGARLAPIENGADTLLNSLCLWSLFLPLGERFSFDSIRASLRRREQQAPGELNDRGPIRTPARRVYSIACFALILQFFAIYALSVLPENGSSWWSGDAVHYLLHQDRLVKLPGVWLREHASVGVLRSLTWMTLSIAALAALAFISPFLTHYTRLFAVIALPIGHFVAERCIDVGISTFAMIAFYPLLLGGSHWAFIVKATARWHKRRLVFVDEDCGFCMLCARLLARLDVLERLEFASNADLERLPRSITLAQADESITTLEPATGRVQRGAAAFAALVRSLPFGFLVAIPLELPGLRVIAERTYALVAGNRLHISLWIGYGACGLPQAEDAVLSAQSDTSPAGTLRDRGLRVAREACVVLCLLVAVSELCNTNPATPAAVRHPQPRLFTMLAQYPRVFQFWRVLPPPVPQVDSMIEVDALTVGGRHVDPYNEIASRVPGPGFAEIPAYLKQNQFFSGYSLFAQQPQFRAYSTAFEEWILRYPKRTGRAEDRVVSFSVYALSDRSPIPGKAQPTNFQRERLFSGPR
jgi:predicted DCC family thiol-disulfide oxidoreductase YuxK